jgi:LuxR family maltose regulon positive regulatory protein
MLTPILATKLHIPPSRPNFVLRPRLIERLNEGMGQNLGFGRKLTLISAPAGFGKTTLISDWLYQSQVSAAWVSLDEGDNDPTRFLAYLVAALQTIAPNLGEGVLNVLQSLQPSPIESILTTLLNEIATVPDPFVLVLDDYHMVEANQINHALTFLLEHMPPQMHLVIATREDPNLPLARYRVRGQLTELRDADLRFTPAEAAEFLNQVMSLNLSAENITALESRTEGWIAGLQLAALALQGTISMQGHQDATNFIKSFTGSHRFVLDYLAEEVLQQQPESVQNFLLRTSVLDRLCGPLCDAVCSAGTASSSKGTGVLRDSTASGQETLEYFERANLLVVPLDDERQWYRYHHLFADVLRARLIKEQPDQVRDLHRRACEWFEQNDLRPDAIRHALAAEEFERAADLIELARSQTRMNYFQSSTYLEWVKALPYDLIRTRPVLSVGYIWELLNFGQMEAAETLLRDAERWLEPAADTNEPPAQIVVVNEEEFSSLRASLANARAYHAQSVGNAADAVKYAQQALSLVSETDHYTRGIAASLLGLAYWTNGELEMAYKSLADGRASLQMAGNISFALSSTYAMAGIRIAQGRLHQAISTYEQALQIAAAQGESMLQGMADLYLGLSDLYFEQGHLEIAKQHLLKGEALGEQAGLPDWQYRLCLVQARIKQSQRDLDGALDQLDEAERLYYSVPVPEVRPLGALKARVWIAQGKLNKARGWARERGLSVSNDLSYIREFEHITLARLFIAQYRNNGVDSSIHKALELLDQLLQAAEAGKRTGSVIEILVLQALAHQAQGDIPTALVPLERALALAEPEGYIRIFVDEGQPMAALLREAAKYGTVLNYVRQLQAAFGKAEDRTPSTQPLIEPLSERELEVLRLLRTELNGPEIARELMVSLNTMRTHTKNIYNKLGVNNRRAAVRRAEELNLL